MIKRILNLPAMPTAIVLVAVATAVALFLHRWEYAFFIPYGGAISILISCGVANHVRYRRFQRHPLSNLLNSELRYLCRQHPEIEVTFWDSVRSGNCIPGTRQFVKRTFKGRRSITLPELARYVGRYRVDNVIVYKLRQAKVDWNTEREGYMQAQRAGYLQERPVELAAA